MSKAYVFGYYLKCGWLMVRGCGFRIEYYLGDNDSCGEGKLRDALGKLKYLIRYVTLGCWQSMQVNTGKQERERKAPERLGSTWSEIISASLQKKNSVKPQSNKMSQVLFLQSHDQFRVQGTYRIRCICLKIEAKHIFCLCTPVLHRKNKTNQLTLSMLKHRNYSWESNTGLGLLSIYDFI